MSFCLTSIVITILPIPIPISIDIYRYRLAIVLIVDRSKKFRSGSSTAVEVLGKLKATMRWCESNRRRLVNAQRLDERRPTRVEKEANEEAQKDLQLRVRGKEICHAVNLDSDRSCNKTTMV